MKTPPRPKKEPTEKLGKDSPFEIESPKEDASLHPPKGEGVNPWRIYERAKRRIRRESNSPKEYERRLSDLIEYLQL